MMQSECEKTSEGEFRVIIFEIDPNDHTRSVLDIMESTELEWIKEACEQRGYDKIGISVLNRLTGEFEAPEFMTLVDAWEECADQAALDAKRQAELDSEVKHDPAGAIDTLLAAGCEIGGYLIRVPGKPVLQHLYIREDRISSIDMNRILEKKS